MLSAGLALLAAGAAAHGAFHRNSPIFGPAIWRLPPAADGEPRVSLTFDDGPNPVATPRILDALGEAGVRATFFVLGRHAERWPDLVARAAREGHQIANHGYHHRKLHRRGPAYVREDIAMGRAAIEQASGATPAFFRAPHGFRSPWVTAIAASMGERTVGWTLGVWDTARPGADEIARRTVQGARARSILLLHDGDGYDPAGDRTQTADALPAILRGLAERGLGYELLPEAAT
jgi:peptidoglycan/xylan/chitin deacetylase (PgdA/CDA1 family)